MFVLQVYLGFFKVPKGLLSLKHGKVFPKHLLAQFLVQPEADGATAWIFAGCFSPFLIFTVLQL